MNNDNETDPFRKEIENADLEYPDPWEPEPGDVLIATVDEYDSYIHDRWGKQYVVNCTSEEGDRVAVWLSHTVLLDAFKKQRPEPGERIGIKYHGPHPEKDYRQYTLKVDRDSREAVPDFDDTTPKDSQPEEDPVPTGEKMAEQVREQVDSNGANNEPEQPQEDPTADMDIPF